MGAPGAIAAVQSRVAQIEARLGIEPPRAGDTAGDTAGDFDSIMAQYGGTTGSSTGSMLGAGGANGGTSIDQLLARISGAGGVGPLGAPAAGAGSIGERVATMAHEYLGIPYVWGGTDPNSGLDCSGLVQHVYRRVGVELPRVSADQARVGTPVASLDQAQPGDLIAWDRGPRNVGADHIAIYMGNGMMIEAPRTGGKVQLVPVGRTPDFITRVAPASPTAPTAVLEAPTGVGRVPFAELFAVAGARHGVDPALLASVAKAESGFDPRAVSHAGAQGLMQLMPGTAKGLGVTDSFDPAQAIDGAARLLKGHLARFGSVELALAAYNAGPGAVSRFGGIPPYRETQAYVPKVLANLQELRR